MKDMYIWPEIAAARERCTQERFFVPRLVVPGVFCQLSCGCIWQDEEYPESDMPVYGSGSTYCEHCERTVVCAYVALWRTIYSQYVHLCTGPLTEESDYHLRNRLWIKCPISPYF